MNRTNFIVCALGIASMLTVIVPDNAVAKGGGKGVGKGDRGGGLVGAKATHSRKDPRSHIPGLPSKLNPFGVWWPGHPLWR